MNHARRGRVLKALSAAAVLAIAGTVYVTVAGAGERQPAKGTPGRNADLAVVQRTAFDISTTATGELKAQNQKEIRSELETESAIVEIVPEGSMAKAGQVLVKLNGDPIQTQIDEEELRAESAKAELIAAENGFEIQKSENESKLRQAKLKLELAQLALDQWANGEHKQKQQDLELALDESSKELVRLREKLDNSKGLFKEGFLSKDQLQMDEIAYRKAEAAVSKAKLDSETYTTYQEKKDRKSKESDVAEAQAEMDRVMQQNAIELASKDAERLNKRRQHQLRTEKLGKLKKQLDACTMVAPQDGLVVYSTSTDGDFVIFNGQGPLQVGRKVFPNETLIVLPDTTKMRAQVKVHESLAGRVKPGQIATVKVDAAGGATFSGKVESIGVLAEGGGWRDPNRREYTVKIAIDHDPESSPLKPSMRCEATLTLGTVEKSLTVPIQSVFSEDQVRFVYTPSGGRGSRFVRVPVGLGQRSDTLAEITAGLTEGMQVLIRQPQPSEIIQAPWDEGQLKVAGFKLGEDGKPVPIGGGRGPARGAGARGAKPVETAAVKAEAPVVAKETVTTTEAKPVTPAAPTNGSN